MERTLYRTGGVACSALVLLAVSVSTALAQLPTGTILGTVGDSTGAVIPGSTVTLRNVETGLTRTQKSEANGSYRLVALPAGTYEVRAEQTGFQTAVRSNVGLAVGQEAVVNFSLQVGAITQTVEVTGEAPLVNTTSGSLGTLVNEQQVSDLPLNGRNYVDLTLLQPGVVQNKQNNPSLSGAGTWISINGAPLRSNYYMLDGAPMGRVTEGTSSSVGSATLGVEGIREWRVVTSSFSAEYGMRMGGQMTLVSKGGTNSFHGSLFEYFRNDRLDARNFFDYPTEATPPGWRLPPFRRNQFGGSAGGPIKKDKLFFFATYESLRERFGVTKITDVMAAGCHGAANATITNVDCPQLLTTASVTVAPLMAPLLALYPNPNLSGNRYTFPFSQPTNEHYGQVRGDYNFSASDSAFVRYTVDDGKIAQALDYPQFQRVGTNRMNFVTASESHTFGSAIVGTFRFSFSKAGVDITTASDVIGPQYAFVQGETIGRISIGGPTVLGTDDSTPLGDQENVFSYSGDLFYTKGRHNFKFGTLVNRHAPTVVTSATGIRGSISFTDVAAFLQARTTSYSAKTPGSKFYREYFSSTWGFYLQDDLRVRSNLTLNLGLRYEFTTQFTEGHGYNSSLRDIRRDKEFTLGPLFLNPSLKNFSPRFGFAWDVQGDGRTAVRGGFGLLYDVGAWAGALSNTTDNLLPFASGSSVSADVFPQFATLTSFPLVFPPESVGKSAGTMDYHIQNPHLLSYNLTVERQLPFQMALSLGYAGSRGLNLISLKAANPRLQTIQSDGRFFWLAIPRGVNDRINPNFDSITQITTPANSWYNSLQFVLRKQLSRGLQFQSAYTWSKLIDEKSGFGGLDGGGSGRSGIATQLLPRQLDRARSDYDVAHSWRFNAIYRLPERPLQGFLGKVLNGWWTSGILTAQTGQPFTVTTGGRDRSRSSGAGNLPDLNAGRSNSNIVSGTSTCLAPDFRAGQKLGTPDLYYDPCAFSLEPEGFLGNTGRNILIAPGVANLDFSLVKDTRLGFLGEGGSLQFRTEVFNILNRANFHRPSERLFSAPDGTPLSTAARINSTDTKSRQVQFALKVIW